MASILFILLIFVFVIIIVLLSLSTYILSALFGGFMNLKNIFYRVMGWNSDNAQTTSAKSTSSQTASHTSSNNTKGQNKIFDHGEGTYIDFEEVK
ncbi:MAG: DUF4834 family protein [Prevotellaceae bacterium]|nr:DUF4834 family protein [Prevotellaceae bacterium]